MHNIFKILIEHKQLFPDWHNRSMGGEQIITL